MCKDENIYGLKYCPKNDIKQVKEIISKLEQAIKLLQQHEEEK
jgi:hypothetical protein